MISKNVLLVLAVATLHAVVGFAPTCCKTQVRRYWLSATNGPYHVEPISVGSATPKTILTNKDLESIVDTTDEWIQTRTGISERHVLVGQESLRQLETSAASDALRTGKVDPLDIGLVICATSTPDDLYGDAAYVAHKLGCRNAFAFDLTAACSGFLFSIITACQYLNNSNGKALVIGAEALSRWADWTDRNTCVLGGDAAGAMVLSSKTSDKDTGGGIIGYAAHSDGEGYPELNCPYGGTPVELKAGVDVTSGSYQKTTMNGREVYKFATSKVPMVIEEALETAGLEVSEIDWLLLHQANIRIMEAVAERLGVPMDKVIANIDKYGNTGAASIPLALTEAVSSGKVKPGDIIACSGFGAGLSWGAVIMKWGGSES